jgi:hypothetical protein
MYASEWSSGRLGVNSVISEVRLVCIPPQISPAVNQSPMHFKRFHCAFTPMSSPARRAADALEVRLLEPVRAQVRLSRSPSPMVNSSSPPEWRRPNGDDMSDASTHSIQRRHSQRTAYWTGAAVAQLPGVRLCMYLATANAH